MIEVEPVSYDVVAPFASRAAKEHVALGRTANTEWFAVQNHGEMRGFAALMKIGSGFRLKGFWVHPDHRGNGIGTALLTTLIGIAEDRCASKVEALALNPRIYETLGFRRATTMRTGAVKVLKLL